MTISPTERERLEEAKDFIKTRSLNELTGTFNYARLYNSYAGCASSEAGKIFREIYIATVGPEEAFEAGSSICSDFDGFDLRFEDPKLMEMALEVISTSNPVLAKNLARKAEDEMEASYRKPIPSGLSGDIGWLSETFGYVTPWGRRDRRTGMINR